MSIAGLQNELYWQREAPAKGRLRRWTVNMEAIAWIGDQPLTCSVYDISPGGARIRLPNFAKVVVGSTIELALPDFPTIEAEVRYRSQGAIGLRFHLDEAGEVALGRYLVSRRPPRREPRRKLHLKAILTPCQARSECIVRDISRTGASISLEDASQLSKDDDVLLSIPGYGEVYASVRRIEAGEVGVMFHNALVGALPKDSD